MVYFYYLQLEVVSSSKDALIMNNTCMATVNIMKFFGIHWKKLCIVSIKVTFIHGELL